MHKQFWAGSTWLLGKLLKSYFSRTTVTVVDSVDFRRRRPIARPGNRRILHRMGSECHLHAEVEQVLAIILPI